MLPVKREQLLWGKFVFSLTGGLLLAESMLLLSDLMLDMPPDVVVLHEPPARTPALREPSGDAANTASKAEMPRR